MKLLTQLVEGIWGVSSGCLARGPPSWRTFVLIVMICKWVSVQRVHKFWAVVTRWGFGGRVEHHRQRSGTSHLKHESLLLSSVYCFVDGAACFSSDEVVSQHVSLTVVVAQVLDCLEMDFWSVVELWLEVVRESGVCTATLETWKTSPQMLLASGNNSSAGLLWVHVAGRCPPRYFRVKKLL